MDTTKKIDLTKMKSDPRHKILESLTAEAARDFILMFLQVHDAFGATAHEFVNGAAIKNKEDGTTRIVTLNLTVENDVTEERLNQYHEESLIEEERLNKKWSEEEK